MCWKKSARKNWTLTCSEKLVKNHTLTVHFSTKFPPFFQKISPFRASKPFFFLSFTPLQCIFWIFLLPTLTVHLRISKNRPSSAAHDVGQTIWVPPGRKLCQSFDDVIISHFSSSIFSSYIEKSTILV